jgi:hypothetical protein
MLALTIAAIICLASLCLGGGAYLYGFIHHQTCLLNVRARRDTAQDGVFFYAAEHQGTNSQPLDERVPAWQEYLHASHRYRTAALPGGSCEYHILMVKI